MVINMCCYVSTVALTTITNVWDTNAWITTPRLGVTTTG